MSKLKPGPRQIVIWAGEKDKPQPTVVDIDRQSAFVLIINSFIGYLLEIPTAVFVSIYFWLSGILNCKNIAAKKREQKI